MSVTPHGSHDRGVRRGGGGLPPTAANSGISDLRDPPGDELNCEPGKKRQDPLTGGAPDNTVNTVVSGLHREICARVQKVRPALFFVFSLLPHFVVVVVFCNSFCGVTEKKKKKGGAKIFKS